MIIKPYQFTRIQKYLTVQGITFDTVEYTPEHTNPENFKTVTAHIELILDGELVEHMYSLAAIHFYNSVKAAL